MKNYSRLRNEFSPSDFSKANADNKPRPRNLMGTRDARSVDIGFSCVGALCGQLRCDLRNPAGEIASSEEQHLNRVNG